MNETTVTLPARPLTAAEIRKLSPHERDALLANAAALAEAEYRANRSLTDFEAFAAEEVDDE